MATTKLQMKFGTMSGVKTWTFNYSKDNPTQERVVALAQAMINNGSIYKYPPLTPDSAKVVVTQETEFDISSVTPAPSTNG